MKNLFENYMDYQNLNEDGTLGKAGKQHVLRHYEKTRGDALNKLHNERAFSKESVDKAFAKAGKTRDKVLDAKSRNKKAAALRLKHKGKEVGNKIKNTLLKSNGKVSKAKVAALGVAGLAGTAYAANKIHNKKKKKALNEDQLFARYNYCQNLNEENNQQTKQKKKNPIARHNDYLNKNLGKTKANIAANLGISALGGGLIGHGVGGKIADKTISKRLIAGKGLDGAMKLRKKNRIAGAAIGALAGAGLSAAEIAYRKRKREKAEKQK
jgi:hypothetical protein